MAASIVSTPLNALMVTGTFGIRKATRLVASSSLASKSDNFGAAPRSSSLLFSFPVRIAKPVLTRCTDQVLLREHCSPSRICSRIAPVESWRHGCSLSRRRKSRLSTFALGTSLFWALAAGRGTAFAVGTAFCRIPFLATVAQVLSTGRARTAGRGVLLASGALWVGFTGRGGRTSGVEAGPMAIYCAMAARR